MVCFFSFFSDGNIRYYEYDNDELFSLSEFKAIEPQRGMAFMPKRALHINECEIARAYKVGTTLIEPVSFTVPRKVSDTILKINNLIY
jgi:coronin-1B/1C/6